jgi:hypothetical protein
MPLPYFFIGKELTSERIGNYSSKHTLLSDDLGRVDTRSVWYSKEHITKLLEEIEYADGDGLRIFFGAYESTHQDYAGQTCLLMVVTREKQVGESTIHENLSVEDEADFSERSALPRGVPSWGGESILSKRKKDFNHGSPCPPVCDGDDGIEFP